MKILLIVLVLMLASCSHTVRTACQQTCADPYNYWYQIAYDDNGRVAMIASSTRFDLKMDNGTMTEFNTSPEAPSGIIRNAWDMLVKGVGGIIGGIF